MRLLNGVLGMVLLGVGGCREVGIQVAGFDDRATEAASPVPEEQALSNAGRFPEDVSDEVAMAKPPPPLPVRKPKVPQEAAAAAEVPQVDPDTLVGLDFERTIALLGEPALLIEEPPAKIWAYNGSNCVLHVFFYPKVGGSDFRVLSYEIKGGPAGETESTANTGRSKDCARLCLGELLVQAKGGRSGNQPGGQPATGAAGGS